MSSFLASSWFSFKLMCIFCVSVSPLSLPSGIHRGFALHNRSVSIHSTGNRLRRSQFNSNAFVKNLFRVSASHLTSRGGSLHSFSSVSHMHSAAIPVRRHHRSCLLRLWISLYRPVVEGKAICFLLFL